MSTAPQRRWRWFWLCLERFLVQFPDPTEFVRGGRDPENSFHRIAS
jgi:hypothetical protein